MSFREDMLLRISDGSKIKVKSNPQFTKYVWGDISGIAGKEITLVDRNQKGDCLCLTEKGLVDVDYRDIDE